MSGPQGASPVVSGEAFLSKFLQGGLKADPSAVQEAPGFWGYLFGGGSTESPPPLEVPYDLVQGAYNVLDSLLLGLASVVRRPADK
eukprot:2414711-Pyramimonas_sp.AAC.1